MKKRFLVFAGLLFIIGAGVFAQNAKYKEFLNKAKTAEKNKEYVYALGYYYDAMDAVVEDLDFYPKEAYEGWTKLKDVIESGKPGFGTFNVFTLHDEWINLLKNAEKYFTEYPCYVLICSPFQGELDYVNRTATYKTVILNYQSIKIVCIGNILKEGLNTARTSDWKDVPGKDEVLFKSVFTPKDGTPQQIYSNYKVAVFDYRGTYYVASSFSFRDTGSLLDIKFSVRDKKGKVLLQSARYLLGSNDEIYDFTGVTPDIMEILDSGEYTIELDSCYLNYGTYNKKDNTGGRAFVNNLPDIQIPVEKVPYYTEEHKALPVDAVKAVAVKQQFNSDYMVNIDGKFEIAKYEVTQELFGLFGNASRSYFAQWDAEEGEDGNLRPMENITWYDAVEFCNELTKRFMKESDCVYKITDVEYEDSRIISATVEIDNSKNGFRLPTKAEWKKAYVSSSEGWTPYYDDRNGRHYYGYYDDYDEITHQVGLKRPNAYGLYDMSGNVSEFVQERMALGSSFTEDYAYGFSYYGYSNQVGFRVARNRKK